MDDEYERIKQKVQFLENTSSKDTIVDEDEGLIGRLVKMFSKK